MAAFVVSLQSYINISNPDYATCNATCDRKMRDASLISRSVNETIASSSKHNVAFLSAIKDNYTLNCFKKHDVELVCHEACIETASVVTMLDYADEIILFVFIIEIGLKILSKYNKPWRYFYYCQVQWWNIFDFVIVSGAFIPSSISSAIMIIRTLRLLRVLKLLRAFKQLQMILMGLKEGLQSVLYLGMVVSIFWFIFAISGQIWFHSNDSLHLGTFYLAASTIARVFTEKTDRGNVQQCRRVCKLWLPTYVRTPVHQLRCLS